jgi:hypothetical protein
MKKKRRIKRNPVAVKAVSRQTGRKPTARLVSRRKKNTKAGYYPNPIRRRHKRRSNPISGSNILNGVIFPAAGAAAGAIALDVAYGFLPLPAAIKQGPIKYAAKGAGAILLGMLVGMVSKKAGDAVALGGMTVTLHSAMRDAMAAFAPTVALGAYGDELAGLGYQEIAGLGYQEPNNMSAVGDEAFGLVGDDAFSSVDDFS